MMNSEKDKKIIWHPFTQHYNADLPITIKKGDGVYLYDENDKKYVDCVSSWWVNLHGHCNAEIADAIYDQAKKLEHVMFAGFTHEPAVELCEILQKMLPHQFEKFFFSDNGSTAVEVALKMAYQFWWNKNQKDRKIFISFEGGYHGDTFGAMSVGHTSGFFDPFKKLFFENFSIPFPETWNHDEFAEEKEQNAIKILSDCLEKNSEKIVAFICEPLVQGAGGMRICSVHFLEKIIKILKSYGVIVIFDEVMTGFGRTGKNFAIWHLINASDIDIICISKGITGGFLPLSLTITTHEIYNAFLGEHFSKAFAHGHSYTANPLGCAAAIASAKILLRNTTQQSIQTISAMHRIFLKNLVKDLPNIIKSPRQFGTIVAFNIIDEKNEYTNEISSLLKKKFLEKGLIIRPLGNTIYLMPPYCITKNDLNYVYDTITDVLKKI